MSNHATTAYANRATFDKPQQYAIGMKQVFVNGVQVLKDGEHTGAKPGRALWGPGESPLITDIRSQVFQPVARCCDSRLR